MRTTRFMTLTALFVCITSTVLAQEENAGSTQPGPQKEDIFGSDPFSGAPQGEDLFGQSGAGEGGGEAKSKPMQIVIDGKTLKPSRFFDFQVNVDSLTIVGDQVSGSSGMMGGGGGMMEGGGGYGMGSSGGGMMGMGMGGEGGMAGMGGMGGISGSMGGGMGGMAGPYYSIAQVRAYVFDDETREGRTRIEVVTVTWGKKGNAAVGHPLEKLQLPQGKAKSKLAFTPASAKLVENAIRLKIWKMDSIRDFKTTGGKGDQAAEAEQLLKSILTEEYEGQIKRQEYELARLKSQLAKIQDEITRRQGAKDRVIDVQLGKILLEAQGIIGQGEQ